MPVFHSGTLQLLIPPNLANGDRKDAAPRRHRALDDASFMRFLLLGLISLLATPCVALRVSPVKTRRYAIIAGASLVPALVPPRSAHADAIEDIARRNAEELEVAREQKAKAKAAQEAADAAGGVGAGLLGVVGLALIGGVGFLTLGAKSELDSKTVTNLDRTRLMTEAERKKYKNLSAAEKRKLGIND